MAKLPNGVLGNFSGKVGNIVGYTYKGQQCIKQATRKTTKAPTAAQLAQRARFSLAGRFLKPINHFLNGLPPKSRNANSRSSTAIALVQKAMVNDGESWRINYPEVVLCEGNYGYFSSEVAACPSGFSFQCQQAPWARERMEMVYFLIYLPEYDHWIIEEAEFEGEKAKGEVVFENCPKETTAEVFAISTFSRGSKTTYSFYAGSVQITPTTNPE
ncbi:DUF6266 family protein [Desertivirga arenae]|uniref:DUF6266 family protein n=1 Tax=Desertivirga arenae TaxID=2810309 RepID=UPI001A967AA2|nr:DUF6266 family protein [Pedobacter sp. SYSU D00823]